MAKVGVVALQGAFREQAEAFAALGAEVVEVRTPAELSGVEVVVLPGGESTTITRLLDRSGLREPVRELLGGGTPALCTCAGLIIAAAEVLDGRSDQVPLGVLDVRVRRNAYGRQRESFEAPVQIAGLAGGPFPGVFIRAPVIEATGPGVEVLARHGGTPVLVRQGRLLGATFHPELAGDLRVHQLVLQEV